MLHRWCLEGLGLSWRSVWEIQSELDSGELVTVLDDYALDNYDIMAIYPPQRHLPLKTRLFIDMLKEIYNQPGILDSLILFKIACGFVDFATKQF